MISRCSSPIPEMSVCPGLLVGRDAEGRILLGQAREARAELVLVALRLRLDRDVDDGPGNVIDSSTIGAESVASVSPVVVCFSPTPAAISPAAISSRSSRWFACIWRMRPMRSVLPFVVFSTRSPALSVPE